MFAILTSGCVNKFVCSEIRKPVRPVFIVPTDELWQQMPLPAQDMVSENTAIWLSYEDLLLDAIEGHNETCR